MLMGAVVDFAELPCDQCSAVLSTLSTGGIELVDEVDERGLRWHMCRREGCQVDLAFGPVMPGGSKGVCMYSGALSWWRRPLGMRRLSRVVWSSVLSAGGRPV